MPDFLSITVDTSALRGLDLARPVIKKHLRGAMRYSRALLTRGMKAEMHFANPTGNLEGSIHAEPAAADPYFNAVGTNVTYARFVNYGTGRRGASSGVAHPPDYQYGPKQGMKAQPFAEPAFAQATPAIHKAFATAMQAALSEMAAGGK